MYEQEGDIHQQRIQTRSPPLATDVSIGRDRGHTFCLDTDSPPMGSRTDGDDPPLVQNHALPSPLVR